MTTTYKAIALAAEIKDELAKRSSLLITEGFDSAQNPTILLGAAAAKAAGCFIRVKADWSDNTATVDGLGLTQRVFTPHIVQIAFEANAEAGGADENDVNTWAVLLAVLGTVLSRGTKVEVWLETAATKPTITTFDTASKKKAEFRDLYFPLQNQI